ncbi:MAG: NAD(+) diphosphatase [Synergistaceae bacterium]
MSKYYVFCNGRILLKNGGFELPETESDKELELLFKASGNVDREDPKGDRWAEIDPASELSDKYVLLERRSIWPTFEEKEFFRAGRAFHLMDWQRANRYCGVCGTQTSYDPAEGAMRCPFCGEIYYPVISPAIIVAVEKDGKLLMGHGVNFPPGRFSVLAGFVEPGESLEECVKREVFEETKISVKNIRYFGSQPWPFPRSLMLGFNAEWESGEIKVDGKEVTDASWFAPDEIPDVFRGLSISWKLIENFIKNHS